MASVTENDKIFQALKKKSLAGMGALFVRQIFVKVIFFIGSIVLARLLEPKIFGIYAIVSFVVTFFSTFGDVGIGAALIQKKGSLSQGELSSTFWLQQLLVWVVVATVIAAAPLALKVYPTLPPVGVWLIRSMALSFLFSSLKTIPAILMERDINFNRIAWVDITENFAFQAVAISCAFSGLGVWSFILAAITRALLGVVMTYSLSPWRPSFFFRLESVRGLMKFGLPYQSNQILSFIKDAVTPLLVGMYAGAAAVGYLNWARNLAFAPLIISETFSRVAFPAFSKLQDDRELLSRTIERSIRMLTLVLFPIAAVMVALGPEIIHVIFTDKWLPGINAFYLYCMSPGFVGIFLPMYCGILSLGKSRLLLFITLILFSAEWGAAIPLFYAYGFVGVAMSQIITVPMTVFITWKILSMHDIKIRIVTNIICQFGAAVITGALVKYAVSFFIPNLITLFLAGTAGVICYFVMLAIRNISLQQECLSYIRTFLCKNVNM